MPPHSANRSVNMCVSLGGGYNHCDTAVQTLVLPTCVSNCTAGSQPGGTARFAFPGSRNGMVDWGLNPHVDAVLASVHNGLVTIVGGSVTYSGANNGQGNVGFRPQEWGPGTQITFTGGGCVSTQTFTVASATTTNNMVLTTTPPCAGAGIVSYKVTPLVILVWKTTT